MPDNRFYKKWACQKMIEASQTNIWEGHWACAVLALIHILEDDLTPRELETLIRQNLDKTVEEHANVELYREDKEYAGFFNGLMEQLIQNGNSCNALGHDVIYSYYILDLLADSDISANAELFNAMITLLKGFADTGPGYVTANGNNIVIHPEGLTQTTSRFQLTSDSVLDFFRDFSRPSQMEKGDMQLGHILTHGHSIVELKLAYAENELYILDDAFHARADILTYANNLEQQPGHISSSNEVLWNPMEPPYWEHALLDNRHGHFYKYAYSYLKLNRMAGRNPSDFRLFSRIL